MIGTVYKIEVNKEIYIGSTIETIRERERKHNVRLKQNVRTNKLYEECRKHNVEKIICIPLEVKEIENELEIRLLEQEYIDKLQSKLNDRSAPSGLSKSEQRKQYRDKNREHYKQYRKNIPEKVKLWKSNDYKRNKEKYSEQKKANYIKNKEIVLEQKKEKINCLICNSLIRRDGMREHQKSKKCLESKELMYKERAKTSKSPDCSSYSCTDRSPH